MNWKNILLTALAALLLVGFALCTPAPVITEEAYDVYQELNEE